MRLLQSLKRQLFGYDFFISYARRDTSEYASNLAARIIEKGYSCYLDQWGSDPGKSLPRRLKNTIKSSTLLILLASEEALQSHAIAEEIALFLPTRRVIIPVNFGNIFAALWFPKIEGIALSDETEANIQQGYPSQALVDRALNSFTYVKQTQRIRRSAIAAGLIILIAAVSFVLISNSLKEEIANSNLELEETQKLQEQAQESFEKSQQQVKQQSDSLQEIEIQLADRQLVLAQTEERQKRAEALALKYDKEAARILEATKNAEGQAFTSIHWMGRYYQQQYRPPDHTAFIKDWGNGNFGFEPLPYVFRLDFMAGSITGEDLDVLQRVVEFVALFKKRYPDKKLLINLDTRMGKTWQLAGAVDRDSIFDYNYKISGGIGDDLEFTSLRLIERYAKQKARLIRKWLLDHGVTEEQLAKLNDKPWNNAIFMPNDLLGPRLELTFSMLEE